MSHICLIHGFNSTSRSFGYIERELPKGKYTLVSYDSHQPLLQSIAEVKKQFPKDEDVILIGHSLGGVLATLIAAEKDSRVKKLLTISSPLGGSSTARAFSWLPGSPRLLRDISQNSDYIKRIAKMKLDIDTTCIISISGHLNLSIEQNDSVVSIESQMALKFGKKVKINASHFEVLLHPETTSVIKSLLD